MSSLIVGIIIIILALVALLVVPIFRGMARTARKAHDDFARAIPATAKVLHLHDSLNADGYDTVDVTVTFEVVPPMGKPYPVKTIWSVDPASVSKIQEGNAVSIRIDPDDHRKIYSAEPWAQSLELRQDSLLDSED